MEPGAGVMQAVAEIQAVTSPAIAVRRRQGHGIVQLDHNYRGSLEPASRAASSIRAATSAGCER
jgi:hypothetical protein